MWQEVAAAVPSVVAFDAPDRGDHVAVDPIVLFGRAQQGVVLGHHGAAIRDPALVDQEAEIVPDRRHELRLRG
jgi:hypothetical protein